MGKFPPLHQTPPSFAKEIPSLVHSTAHFVVVVQHTDHPLYQGVFTDVATRAYGRFFAPRRPGPQTSIRSKPVLICAVLPSMMLAEQYFSWLRAMARSTAAAGMPLPVTVKCM